MAPANAESKPAYLKDEKALCFHGELLYEAKILDVKKQDPKDKSSPYEYRVHYKGWKNTWDDWVPQDRLRKNTEENRELAINLKKASQEQNAPRSVKPPTSSKTRKGQSDIGSGRGSEERTSSVPARGTKRGRDNDVEKEESFLTRPSVRIPLPDHLKNILVDDWEYVTKSQLLVPLPAQAPANFIVDSYFAEEKHNRRLDSPEANILEEFCLGLKAYFNASLPKILLYRNERAQLQEVRRWWESGKFPDWTDKQPGDCYGAEHLARMLVNMPELVAQTNMDAASVARLKEELGKFTVWLSRNSEKYFVSKYEKFESAIDG